MQSLALLSLLAAAAFAIDPKSGTEPTYGFDTVLQPERDEVVKAGTTFTIKWETPAKYDDVKLTINLVGGSSPSTQIKVDELASGLDNSDGSYSWTVKSSLGKDKVYGLQLINEKDNSLWQYSEHFSISKSSGGSGGDGDDNSKSTATGDNTSATETGKETGSESTSTASETGDDNKGTATETSASKTTETDSSASETSAAATGTTLTTAPSKSTDASATGSTKTPSSTTSAASQTNAAGVLGSSNMLALGGVAAALFAL